MNAREEYLKMVREAPLSDGAVEYVRRAFTFGEEEGRAQESMKKKVETITLTNDELKEVIWYSVFIVCPVCDADILNWEPIEIAHHIVEERAKLKA